MSEPESNTAKRRRDEAHLDRRVEPEYAAISGWAIFALALAAIGALAWLSPQPYLAVPGLRYQLPILVVLPLAALIVAVAALRNIKRSEGTTVGLAPARVALGLAAFFLVGSVIFHGLHQYQKFKLDDELVAAANGYLQKTFDPKNYDSLLAEMKANGAQAERPEWKAVVQSCLFDGGDYYGRALQSTQTETVERPDGGKALLGQAIYRLTFKEGGVDLYFQFLRDGDRWKLMQIFPKTNPLIIPKEDERPKPRFE